MTAFATTGIHLNEFKHSYITIDLHRKFGHTLKHLSVALETISLRQQPGRPGGWEGDVNAFVTITSGADSARLGDRYRVGVGSRTTRTFQGKTNLSARKIQDIIANLTTLTE